MPTIATSNPPQSIINLLQQAEQFLRQGKYQDTITTCRRVLEISPHSAKVYKSMGNAWQGLDNLQAARNCYARAIEFAPNYVEAYVNLGSLAAKQQHWPAAIRYFQKAIAINPKFAGAYRNLARVWQQVGRSSEALEAW